MVRRVLLRLEASDRMQTFFSVLPVMGQAAQSLVPADLECSKSQEPAWGLSALCQGWRLPKARHRGLGRARNRGQWALPPLSCGDGKLSLNPALLLRKGVRESL